MCKTVQEVRYFDLYVIGSEGCHLCLQCTTESIDSAKYDANGAPLKIDTTFKQPCEGYSCKNEAIFLCQFTNKL